MVEPITLVALTALVVKQVPMWTETLRDTALDKGRAVAIDKGNEFAVSRGERFVRGVLQLDEKEQLRHLQRALKSAIERGLARFDTLEERDLYKDILRTLAREGPQGADLRGEALRVFTLSEVPDCAGLSEIYNNRCRFYDAEHQDVDAGAYLNSFF